MEETNTRHKEAMVLEVAMMIGVLDTYQPHRN